MQTKSSEENVQSPGPRSVSPAEIARPRIHYLLMNLFPSESAGQEKSEGEKWSGGKRCVDAMMVVSHHNGRWRRPGSRQPRLGPPDGC